VEYGLTIGLDDPLALTGSRGFPYTETCAMASPTSFLRRVPGRFAAGLLIVALGLVGYALWLFRHADIDFGLEQSERIAALDVKRREIRGAIEEVTKRSNEDAATMAAEESRARQAEKIIASLRALESTWDRLVGNLAQQKANAEQLARMEEIRNPARAKVAEMKQALTRLTWEKDGLELDLGRLEQEIAFAENHRSVAWHYLAQALQKAKGWVLMLFALYLAGEVAVAKRR
jgi:hypothetical protein